MVLSHLTKPKPPRPSRLAMMSSSPTNAPPQMNRIWLVSKGTPGCCRMLVAALWWHRGDRAFENLQEGVLDAQPHVLEPRTARLDLVDLVDEDDALLGGTEVAIGCLDQPGEQALHVLADVPGFGQAGRITDGEGDVEVGSQGLRPDGSFPSPRDRSAGCWTSR